jgi:hypothetical protein
MKIYIAGAAAEAEVITLIMQQCRTLLHEITVDWTKPILALGRGKTDADLTPEQRIAAGMEDSAGVQAADLFWLIVPHRTTSRGCWVELGMAIAWKKTIWVSGDNGLSIFTALATRQFPNHADVLAQLKGI